MKKKEIEKLFIELQFNDVLDILLDNNIISKQQYDYYMELYYNEKEYKEDFIKNVLDIIKEDK